MMKQALFILLIYVVFSCSKSNSNIQQGSSGAKININSISQQRSINPSVYRFKITLSKPVSQAVSIHYKTVPGTALENKDFLPVSGTISLPANQFEANIDVTVTGDSLRRSDQLFSIELDNPVNVELGISKGSGEIINKDLLYYPVDPAGYMAPTSYPGYTLAWSDEFNSPVINPGTWSFEKENQNGWGNNELEYYTDRTQNAFQSAGNLIIEARAENYNGFGYTSARMITKGKKAFKFGRIDIRAKLPEGKGVWPAIWMMGNNIDQVNWPTCGEMDILEYLGHETNKIYGTLHWGTDFNNHKSKGSSYVSPSGSYNQQFHIYSLLWKQDVVKILVDDVEFATIALADVSPIAYPFNNDFFFIFNVAVGGDWPGIPNSATSFPQRMAIDFVRVFQ